MECGDASPLFCGVARRAVSQFLLCASLLLLTACASKHTAVDTAPAPSAPNDILDAQHAAVLSNQWGVEITSLHLSAHGRMVDFRYRVLDPAKAAMLGKRENKPQLIDQASGTVLYVPDTPKLGPLRQSASRLIKGKIYFALFGNARCIVKAGSKVTVKIGEFKAENLMVE